MNLGAVAGGIFNNSGTLKLFGIRTGTAPVLNGANQANPTLIEAITDVDLLGTSNLIDNTVQWETYTIEFTATQDYDRILISIDGTDSFLGFDNILFLCEVNSDGDSLPDHLDTDSDGDGCGDANEAYGSPNIDSNSDGTYGGVIGAAEVDGDGKVIGAAYNTGVVTAVTDNGDATACNVAPVITNNSSNATNTATFAENGTGNVIDWNATDAMVLQKMVVD